jgi:hypothetical protein
VGPTRLCELIRNHQVRERPTLDLEAGPIAVIAIAEERAQAAQRKISEEIKRSEAQPRKIIDAIPQLVTALGLS